MAVIGAGVLESEEARRMARPPVSGGAPSHAQAAEEPAPVDPAEMADADLVEGTLEGRKECFAELAMRYTDMVATFAYGRTRSRELAEEVAQEAMVRAYEGLWGLKARRRFPAWLLGIARNVCSKMAGDRSRMVTVGSEPLAERAHEAEETPRGLAPEERQKILEEVDSLEEHFRVVFVLHHQMGLPCSVVAERLGLPEGTVRSRLSRAYTLLRAKLRGLRDEGRD